MIRIVRDRKKVDRISNNDIVQILRKQQEYIEYDEEFWRVPRNHEHYSRVKDLYGSIHDIQMGFSKCLSFYSAHTFMMIKMAMVIHADTTGKVVKKCMDQHSKEEHRWYNFCWTIGSPFGEELNHCPFEFLADTKSRKAMSDALSNMFIQYNYYYDYPRGVTMYSEGYKWFIMDCDIATMDVK